MKNILLLVGLAYSTGINAAAINVQAGVTGGNTGGGAFPHFVYLPDGNNAPAPTYLRLAGFTYAKHNGSAFITQDSTMYLFSNGRGGFILPDDPTNDEAVMFDESYSYKNIGSGFSPKLKKTQTYDADGHVDNLTYLPWRQSDWEDSARYLYGYNNDKMTVSAFEIWMGLWAPHIQSNISYTSKGKVAKLESTNYKMEFEYDANNNLVTVTDVQWTINNGWQNKSRQSYTYNTSGIETETLEEWDISNNIWTLTSKWEYTYFASKLKTLTEYKRDGSQWLYVSRYVYEYNPDMSIKNETYLIWHFEGNNFINKTNTAYTYNSAHLVVEINTSHWDGSNWMIGEDDEQYHYYYEPYFPTSVKNTIAEKGVKLFPVPTTNTLNLDISWSKAEAFDIAIYDMRGIMVQHWNEQPAQTYVKQIDVANLPNGNYIIKANSSSAQLTEKFIVAR